MIALADQPRESAVGSVRSCREIPPRLRRTSPPSSASTLPQIALAPALGPCGHFGQVVLGNRRFEVFAELRALADVEYVENRLLAQKHEAPNALLVVSRHLHFAQRLLRFEKGFGLNQQLIFALQFRSLHLL